MCRVERSVAGAAAARLMPRAKACAQPSLRASIHPLKPKRSPGRDHRGGGGAGGGGAGSARSSGLPDDLAVACLIRVPRGDHWKLRLVCRRWSRLLAGNYFYGLRRRLGLAEQWVYAVKRDGEGACRGTCSTRRGGVARAAARSGEYAGAAGFGCAVLGGCHLYLLGGSDPRRGRCGGWCSTAPGATGGTARRTCCGAGTASGAA